MPRPGAAARPVAAPAQTTAPIPAPATGWTGLRPGDSAALAQLAQDCVVTGVMRHVLVLRLALLPAEAVRPPHMRLVHQALEPLAMADHGRLFLLDNDDLAVTWRGDAPHALGATLDATRRLFEEFHPPEPGIAQVLLLPRDADALLAALYRDPGPAPATEEPEPLAPLTPADLTRLEQLLLHADVARFARRRQIWAVRPGVRPRLEWEERFLSMRELGAALAPEHNPRADPWLFRRLTRSLDRRMLALLASAGELRDAGPFALNLNVASILAPEFLRFDTLLPSTLRGQVVIELDPADVLADLSAFVFARDFARARGYRCGLRASSTVPNPALRLEPLGLDLLRLHWSGRLAGLDRDALRHLAGDASRIVLYGADRRTALEWGSARGIHLFQGQVELLQ